MVVKFIVISIVIFLIYFFIMRNIRQRNQKGCTDFKKFFVDNFILRILVGGLIGANYWAIFKNNSFVLNYLNLQYSEMLSIISLVFFLLYTVLVLFYL